MHHLLLLLPLLAFALGVYFLCKPKGYKANIFVYAKKKTFTRQNHMKNAIIVALIMGCAAAILSIFAIL